jgi:hypothetical protein
MLEVKVDKQRDFFEFLIEGKVNDEEIDQIIPEGERIFADGNPKKGIIRIKNFQGYELSALWKDLKFTIEHYKQFGKVAFVGDRKWQGAVTAIFDKLNPGDIRFFPEEELDAAREWLAQAS